MSNESELIDAKISLHTLGHHARFEERMAALEQREWLDEEARAQIASLQADMAAHLEHYHPIEQEEKKEEEHREEQEEDEEDD